jgi:hypothetical protein
VFGRALAALPSAPAVALALAVALGAVPAAAQSPAPASSQPPAVEFLPRSAFHLSAEHISSEDPRFIWDANFGGDVDFVDYRHGRTTFYANYQVILGDEFHIFDPNQGNYILGGSTSARLAGFEFAGVFHHESRHLSDRPKRQPVDWNMVGGRLEKTIVAGPVQTAIRADLRRTIKTSYVDYRWELDTDVRNRYRLRSAIALFSDLDVRFLGVDGSRNRNTQAGYRVEGGGRLEGRGGAVELFAAVERRIDPYPLQFGTATWASVGFRLLSR